MQPFGLKNLYDQSTNAEVYQHQSAVQLVQSTHTSLEYLV